MVQWSAPKPLQQQQAPDIAGPMVAAARAQAEAYAQMGQSIGAGITAAGEKKTKGELASKAMEFQTLLTGDDGWEEHATSIPAEALTGEAKDILSAMGGLGLTPEANYSSIEATVRKLNPGMTDAEVERRSQELNGPVRQKVATPEMRSRIYMLAAELDALGGDSQSILKATGRGTNYFLDASAFQLSNEERGATLVNAGLTPPGSLQGQSPAPGGVLSGQTDVTPQGSGYKYQGQIYAHGDVPVEAARALASMHDWSDREMQTIYGMSSAFRDERYAMEDARTEQTNAIKLAVKEAEEQRAEDRKIAAEDRAAVQRKEEAGDASATRTAEEIATEDRKREAAQKKNKEQSKELATLRAGFSEAVEGINAPVALSGQALTRVSTEIGIVRASLNAQADDATGKFSNLARLDAVQTSLAEKAVGKVVPADIQAKLEQDLMATGHFDLKEAREAVQYELESRGYYSTLEEASEAYAKVLTEQIGQIGKEQAAAATVDSPRLSADDQFTLSVGKIQQTDDSEVVDLVQRGFQATSAFVDAELGDALGPLNASDISVTFNDDGTINLEPKPGMKQSTSATLKNQLDEYEDLNQGKLEDKMLQAFMGRKSPVGELDRPRLLQQMHRRYKSVAAPGQVMRGRSSAAPSYSPFETPALNRLGRLA